MISIFPLDSSFPFMFPKSLSFMIIFRFTFCYYADFLEVTFVHKMYIQHPTPFLFDGKSRTTRIIEWEFAQLSTLVKIRTCDWLSVNPCGNTGSRRRSKINLRGITMGPI